MTDVVATAMALSPPKRAPGRPKGSRNKPRVLGVHAGEGSSKPRGDKRKLRLQSLRHLDKRSAAYRKALDIIDDVSSDLGGPNAISTVRRELLHKFAVASVAAEHLAVTWLSGRSDFDSSAFSTLANTCKRLADALGLERRVKTVTSLKKFEEIIEQREREAKQAAKSTPTLEAAE